LAYITKEIGQALFARTIKLNETLFKNVDIFKTALSAYLNSTAAGDQYGPLLAGAYLLENDDVIEPVDADAIIRKFAWSDFGKPHQDELDHRMCLAAICGTIIPVTTGVKTFQHTIGQLIDDCLGNRLLSSEATHKDAEEALIKFGIRIESGNVWIANNNDELRKRLPERWQGDWAGHLKRLEGVESAEKPKKFAGRNERYKILPATLFEEAE
jgi:putative DNA primase/helicase